MDSNFLPYSFEPQPAALNDLWRRLKEARWPVEIEAAPWHYGPPLDYMKSFVDYWRSEFDWTKQQRKINGFDNYLTRIGDQDVHFIMAQGKGPNPIPLLITHGWPGSFVELLKIIPLLTDPAAHGGDPADSFTVIAPSIPGYGFSSHSGKRGTSVFAIADIWVELMGRLGFTRFGVQGGDWGSWISAATALRHPDRVLGLHLNYISTRFRPATGASDPPLTEEEESYLGRVGKWLDTEGGYIALQATKPLTLSYALSDSPIGLAAWFIEKFKSWSDCRDAPDESFSRDDMITDIMVYWLTHSVNSSLQLYAESREHPLHLNAGERITPPCGIVHLPAEIPMPPLSWAKRAFNVVHWTNLERGGHFAAWEVPDLLARDVQTFFRQLRD